MQLLSEKTLNELSVIINSLEELLGKIDQDNLSTDIEEAIIFSEKQINKSLYYSEEIVLSDVFADVQENAEKRKDILNIVNRMIPIWKKSIERRKGKRIDIEFWTIYEYFKYVAREMIISRAEATFDSYPEEYKQQFITLPQRYTFLTGKLDINDGDYSLIPIYTDMMKEEIEGFRWLYDKLADYRSKYILLRIVRFWFDFDLRDLSDLHENIFKDYCDLDILRCDSDSVLVDCGAFVGDSALDFIHTYGKDSYSRIYCYEIDEETMARMKQNLEEYDNIIYVQKGVGRKKGSFFLEEGITGAGTRIAENGTKKVEVVSIDEDITEPIDMIKMDIEGAETDALYGAQRHIINEKPQLMICTYHRPADLFSIPRIIQSIREDYTFYLRFNGRGIWPCDHVLFAV